MVSWNIWNFPLQTNDHEPIRFWGGYNELIQNKPNRDLIYMKWIIIKTQIWGCKLVRIRPYDNNAWDKATTIAYILTHWVRAHEMWPCRNNFSVLFGSVRKLFTSLGVTERYSPPKRSFVDQNCISTNFVIHLRTPSGRLSLSRTRLFAKILCRLMPWIWVN